MGSLPEHKDLAFREIKSNPITESEIDAMAKLAGSYEALFSRRAMKYRSMGLNEKNLSESDYKKYILEENTFLKRPVLLSKNQVFVGNAKNTVAEMQAHLSQ